MHSYFTFGILAFSMAFMSAIDARWISDVKVPLEHDLMPFAGDGPALEAVEGWQGVGNPPTIIWEKCKPSKNFGQVCIGIYENLTDTPSSVGVEFQILGATFYAPVVRSVACLSDTAVLAALAHDPDLAPLAKEIHALMILEKVAGAELVSECVTFSKTVLTRRALTSCAALHSRLGCLRNKCLQHSDDDFGCFTVPLPHHKDDQEAMPGTFASSFSDEDPLIRLTR
eukprot:TRINITY_DN6656_c0_g1_i1.p1 TRINITY_DN6656_c0_g1~~TRINITY_DN6656_c0_g1_i1.p1  ORF type:complete len:227 (+),score=35.78 TRINITY_DN6656_c0_g1_i1:90-770(+)